MSVLTRTTLYVEPERARYGSLVPKGPFRAAVPLSRGVRPERAALPRLGRRPPQRGASAAHPEAAARLLDGSPAGHSLCPSAPEAVEYVAALAGDVAAQLGPEAVDLEAGFYPAWEPSYTLTLALEPLSERARLLGAQCFCDSCRALFGPEAEARAHAAAGPPFGDGEPDEPGQRSSPRVAPPARRGSCGRCGSRPRRRQPAPRLRLRPAGAGGAPGRLGRLVCRRRCAPLRLRPARGRELQDRFAGLRALTGRSGAVSTNWTPDRTELAADVERLAAAGAEGLALYNLSLVPEAGLEAFRAAAHAFRAAVPV